MIRETLLQELSTPLWQPAIDLLTSRVGDFRTEEGLKFLTERSPLTHVERISKPLLIGQGANDPRVKQAESDQIVEAMQQKAIPVTYVLYSGRKTSSVSSLLVKLSWPTTWVVITKLLERTLEVHLLTF